MMGGFSSARRFFRAIGSVLVNAAWGSQSRTSKGVVSGAERAARTTP